MSELCLATGSSDLKAPRWRCFFTFPIHGADNAQREACLGSQDNTSGNQKRFAQAPESVTHHTPDIRDRPDRIDTSAASKVISPLVN
jgi:hypothetical protein